MRCFHYYFTISSNCNIAGKPSETNMSRFHQHRQRLAVDGAMFTISASSLLSYFSFVCCSFVASIDFLVRLGGNEIFFYRLHFTWLRNASYAWDSSDMKGDAGQHWFLELERIKRNLTCTFVQNMLLKDGRLPSYELNLCNRADNQT